MNKFKFLVFILLFCQVLFSKDTVSVQLLWKHQFEFSGFYVAKELGFYNDIGLDVEIKEITPNINVASEVENKNATFGIGRTSLLINIENGKDFILLSPIFQYSPSILLTLKSSGIKDPNDLFGKKVMIASGSEYDAEFFTAFRNMGIDFLKDTTIQQHSTSINDLINGNTDAMYAYISNEPFLLKEQGIEYNILNPKNYGFDFYGDIVFTTKEFAMENPILVKKFREATHKGFEWAFANIDKTIDLIYNKYNSQNKSKDALRYEAYELKKIAYYETDRIGTITKSKLQRMVDLYKNNGLLKTNLNTDEIVFEYDKYNLSLTPEELGYLKNKKILKVHNELEYKPFNFFKSNMPTGYSIDLMNLVAKKLNVQVEYQTGPSWSDFIEMLKVGDIDVMLNITPTQGRKEFFNFTNPYKKYNYLIYSNVTKKISSINDLDGKKVALIKDFAVYEIIKSLYPKIEIVEVKSMKDAIIAVGLSQADATITIQPIAQNIIFENGIYNVIPTGEIFLNDTDSSQVNLSMATNKKDNILNGILNKALYSITYDEMIQLEQKWFASTQSSEQNIIFTTQESEYLKDKKVVHLCVDPNWMPFESIEKGKLIGVSKDFMDIFETKLGIPIKLIPTKTWQESIKLAKARECDIFSLATQTEPRKEYMNFTTPYVSTPLVIATKHDKLFIANIEDIINSEKIGIVKGYAYDDIYNQRYPNNKLVTVNSIKEGLDLVASGQLYGFIDSLVTIGYFLKEDYLGQLKIAGKFDDHWDLSIGVRNDDLILLGIFQKVVDSIDAKTKNTIINKWTGVVFETNFDKTFIFKWIIVIFFVILIMAYRHNVLKRYNNQLHKANLETQNINDKLKLAYEEIYQKQQELYILNQDLEKKIRKEVEANLLKDKLLQHQTKLAQMGELISMIAHQWRQPLASIASTAIGIRLKIELNKYDLSTQDGVDEFISYILEQLNDMEIFTQTLNQTIDDFRDFYKPTKELKNSTIDKVVIKALDIIQISLVNKSNVNIIKEFNSIKEISMYRNEMMQVVLNILKNAEDNFTINNIEEKIIKIISRDVSDGVELEIWDNGGGILEENLDKIFDPYFTTKQEKEGTGLGLYIAKIVVCDNHKGEMFAKNNNSGVSFIIKLKDFSS